MRRAIEVLGHLVGVPGNTYPACPVMLSGSSQEAERTVVFGDFSCDKFVIKQVEKD